MAWEKVGGVRIPTMYLGVEIDYKSWEGDKRVSRWGMEYGTRQHNPGSIYADQMTLEMVLRNYMYFLEREGFKLVVVVSGHGTGEHLDVIRDVCERYTKKGSMKAVMWNAWGHSVPEDLRFEGAGQHGDFDEASVLGAVDSRLVDKSKFGVAERDRRVHILSENADKIDFEKGRKLIELAAEQLEKDVDAQIAELKL
jgi:creatinine amidohydrolase/Fe(II)-dependent formamide hydrolase-like protein